MSYPVCKEDLVKPYKVECLKTVSVTIEVDAENYEQAIDIAFEMMECDEINWASGYESYDVGLTERV